MSLMTFLLADGIGKIVTNIVNHLIIHMTMHFLTFLGTDVSPFPNFNNSVLTTRRNLLLHC